MTTTPSGGIALPPPRTPGRYRVALVCLGNICRSPMADVVLSERLAGAGLAERVEVTSSGTGGWHVGHPMDERAAATLTRAGYDATRHRARQFAADWLEDRDLVLAMDAANLAHVRAAGAAAPDGRVRLFRDFDPVAPGGDVPDPYYGGDAGFEEVLAMVERTADALVTALATAVGTAVGALPPEQDAPGSRTS
jgi:protein-tyrosine phosphatase